MLTILNTSINEYGGKWEIDPEDMEASVSMANNRTMEYDTYSAWISDETVLEFVRKQDVY